jgi:anti-sigma B factor antagonist
MSLEVRTRKAGNVTVVDVSGKLVLGKRSGELREAIRDLLLDGQKRIVLNLEELEYVDSSGIAELVSSLTATTNRGGAMKLVKVGKKVTDVLRVTKLTPIFDVYNDEGEALRSFEK